MASNCRPNANLPPCLAYRARRSATHCKPTHRQRLPGSPARAERRIFCARRLGARIGPSCAPPARRALERVRTHFRCAQAGRADDCPHGSRRRTKADIAVMQAAVQAYIDAADRDESRLADTALHLAVAEATHNPVLVGMSQDLRAKITLNLGAEPYTAEARRTAIVQHAELVAAVTDGEGELALRNCGQYTSPSPKTSSGSSSIVPSTTAREAERDDEPAAGVRRAAPSADHPHAPGHERRRVPDHPARAGRPGAHHAGLPRDGGKRRATAPPAWTRSSTDRAVLATGRARCCAAISARISSPTRRSPNCCSSACQ